MIPYEQPFKHYMPYDNVIIPLLKFNNITSAFKSSKKIYQLFLKYVSLNDFLGAHRACHWLHVGYQQSSTYTKYRKMKNRLGEAQRVVKGKDDKRKLLCANIFYQQWQLAEAYPTYLALKKQWISEHFYAISKMVVLILFYSKNL